MGLTIEPDEFTFVAPSCRVVYHAVPKAACTSIKWLIADLNGEDRDDFKRSFALEVSPDLVVHDRRIWQKTPRLSQIASDGALDDTWFDFVVLREPVSRFFSAWQSKFLMNEPRFRRSFPDLALTTPPRSRVEVVDRLTAFVEATVVAGDHPVLRDPHFARQREFAHAPGSPESESLRVYTTKQIPALLADLDVHLTSLARGVPPLARSNESPLRVEDFAQSEWVEPVAAYYAEDSALVPAARPPAQTTTDAGAAADQALALLPSVWDRHQRIDDLVSAHTPSLSRRLRRRLLRSDRGVATVGGRRFARSAG